MSYLLYIALMALSGWGIIEFLPVLASWSIVWIIIGGLALGFLLNMVLSSLCGICNGIALRSGSVAFVALHKVFAFVAMVAVIIAIWTTTQDPSLPHLTAARIIASIESFYIFGTEIAQ